MYIQLHINFTDQVNFQYFRGQANDLQEIIKKVVHPVKETNEGRCRHSKYSYLKNTNRIGGVSLQHHSLMCH